MTLQDASINGEKFPLERGEKLLQLILSSEKYKPLYVPKSFQLLRSKKNTVCKVMLHDRIRVLKWFAPGFVRNMEVEYRILKQGGVKLTLPAVFDKDDENHLLILGYIIGENLCDYIHNVKKDFQEKQKVIEGLAEWFAQFHDFFYIREEGFWIRGDANLRNFLVGDRIWGVDFEEARRGQPVEDLAEVCVSILTTDPLFTKEKFQFCRVFLNSYRNRVKWEVQGINNQIAYALLEKIPWRRDQEVLFKDFAAKIRSTGLAQIPL